MSAGDQDAIALAERVLAILDEGGFSATSKYALFTAILDLCIEKTTIHGTPPETLTTRQLGNTVVELYWNHVSPYGSLGMLRQGGAQREQATIVDRIERARAQWTGARLPRRCGSCGAMGGAHTHAEHRPRRCGA